VLGDFAQAVNASVDDLDRTLKVTAVRVSEEIGDMCAIWLLSDDGEWLDNAAMHAHDPAALELLVGLAEQRRHVDSEPMATTVVREGVTLFLPDIPADEPPELLAPEHQQVTVQIRPTSLISAPLRARGEVIGTINVARAAPGSTHFVDADRTFLEELAAWAAVAIDNAKLYRKAADAAHALQLSEQRLRAMFDSSSVGIVARDPEGVLLECNPAYASMLGYTPEELVGTHASLISPPDADPRPAVEPREREVEFTYRRRDGSELHARVTASPVSDGSGRLLYWMGLVEDLTRRRHLEDQLRQSQKMEAVGQLAGGVAHDFNNLLTVIAGYARMAKNRIGVGPGAEELEEVVHAADRAAQLTRQLLAFSRRQILNPQPLDLGQVAKGLLPMLHRLIGEDIDIAMAVEPDLPLTLADRMQIEQVVLNLALNARDAMPTGGTLTLETRRVELGEAYVVEHLTVEPGLYACLIVTDSGVGMTPETKARAFDPFFTTKAVGSGTGLGLATVHGIVNQSGGRIEVYSELELGSSFKIYFPAETTAPPAGGAEPAPEVALAGGTETVLICEDEEALRRLAERSLVDHGYLVLSASRPSEALQLARAHPGSIGALVTDVVMPEMSGPELAEHLRSERPGVRVLFMSGYTAETIGARGNLPEGSTLIEKPFALDELPRAVRELLDEVASELETRGQA